MSSVGWSDPASYAKFLKLQYAARVPVESWIEGACPPALQPPKQSHLIAEDLAALDHPSLKPEREFSLPPDADPLGAVWALAGSSLGNAVILRSVTEAHAGQSLPLRFLSDTSMHAFWKQMLPALDAEIVDAAALAARAGAIAVFEHFHNTILSAGVRQAA